MQKLSSILGYKFSNKKNLLKALTHSSYANEHTGRKISSNERLEFLGDSVLGLLVSDFIYKNYYNMPEGELTKIRATVVCEKSLYERAKDLNLGKYLFLGKGEEATCGRERMSILADAFEALIGAVYIDGGIEAAYSTFIPILEPIIKEAASGKTFKDYKTMLQEIVQRNKEEVLNYAVKSESGPDHLKVFEVELYLNNNVFATGKGGSKKEAEQQAARLALVLMGELEV